MIFTNRLKALYGLMKGCSLVMFYFLLSMFFFLHVRKMFLKIKIQSRLEGICSFTELQGEAAACVNSES